MFKEMMTVAVASVLILGVTGCSGNKQAGQDELVSTFNVEPMSPDMDANFEQHVKVVSENKAEIHLGGSGSCPPDVERVEIRDNVVSLKLKDWGDKMCTMDYRLYSQLLTTTSSINLNDYNFEVCTPLNECSVLPKNVTANKEVKV